MALSALIIDDEPLAREELEYLLEQMGGVEILAQGGNGIEALNLIDEHHPDLVFLDVQMPGLDGFQVIQKLAERRRLGDDPSPLPQIVFATAYDQYAVRAFDVNAADYLLKPFDRDRVEQAVSRARERLATHSSGSIEESQIGILLKLLEGRAAAPAQRAKVVVQTQNRLLLVDQAEICFASIDEGILRVITPSLEGQSKCRTLDELQELLDPAIFWRAHRGFLVNIDHIREVVPWFKSSYQLRMDDKHQTEIPVSRAQTRRLRELFKL